VSHVISSLLELLLRLHANERDDDYIKVYDGIEHLELNKTYSATIKALECLPISLLLQLYDHNLLAPLFTFLVGLNT
jgi:hypothetical protein